MQDGYGRNIHYLRVSVTDRCNLRCGYCMPEEGVEAYSHDEILHFDEITRVVRVMSELGVDRVRLTGGEPLVRKGICTLARQIREIDAIRFLGLTTNGILLSKTAEELFRAGVEGLNISLDTVNPERYGKITRRVGLEAVLEGINSALEQPFKAVKINCVLSPGSIEEDWLGVLALAEKLPVDVRLIEWMPMAGENALGTVGFSEARAAIEARFGALSELAREEGAGPARYWSAEGFKGRIGFIHAMSECFCDTCNRVRLTSVGDLKLCLFYDAGVSLKPLLRGGASDEELKSAICEALANKPKKHRGRLMTHEEQKYTGQIARGGGMYKTGG